MSEIGSGLKVSWRDSGNGSVDNGIRVKWLDLTIPAPGVNIDHLYHGSQQDTWERIREAKIHLMPSQDDLFWEIPLDQQWYA